MIDFLKNPNSSLALSLALGALLGLNVACSRGTSIYSDPKQESADSITPISTDGRAFLPDDFYNQSVGKASVDLQLDGTTAASKAIRFQTEAGAGGTGQFNGGGTGNRAILGLGTWNGRPLPQLNTITFDARTLSGVEKIGVALQVDLQCDGTTVRVIKASGEAIATNPTTSAGDGYTRWTASFTSAIWLAVDTAIVDPANSASDIVPTSGAVTLTNFLAKYPAACLKNFSTGASDLPAGIRTAAVLWTLGSDTTTTANSVFVRRITVGGDAAVVTQ